MSEEADIGEFVPRPCPTPHPDIDSTVVWAIDRFHLIHYLAPRDCPRVCCYVKNSSTQSDISAIIGPNANHNSRLIAFEKSWSERIHMTPIFIYAFQPDSFELIDSGAGYWVSFETIRPSKVFQVKSPIALLEQVEELRVRRLDNLWELHKKVIASTLQFSSIRMRNAQPET